MTGYRSKMVCTGHLLQRMKIKGLLPFNEITRL